MMQQPQRKLRDTADEAFMESLDKLQEILESQDTQAVESEIQSEGDDYNDMPIDLAAFEDAAADIEAYIQEQE
jgi:hypothetical protein